MTEQGGRAAEARWVALAGAVVVGVAVVVLRAMGRIWWCACDGWSPVSFDTWSPHNSQHLFDAYTFSHVLHGVVFYGALRLLLGARWPAGRVVGAAAIEAAWEVLENTPWIIDRYRAVTVSLDYTGDTVVNSIADIASCVVGYLFSRFAPAWASVTLFVATELVMLAWIRDSLLLNVLMLVWPVEAVRVWQSGG